MSASRIRRASIWFLVAALALPEAAAAQQGGTASMPNAALPSDSAVLSVITQRVKEGRSAGIVVGLLGPDGSTRVVAFGDPGPGQPPLDGNSVFEIGSISKVFTATALAELVQSGTVRLDEPVQKFLPDDVTVPSRDGKQITLLNLSEQNSGLPRMPSNFHPKDLNNPYADYTVQQLWDFLSHYTLPRDPGAEFEYSNLGVGLLGQALSRATGESYEAMERRMVWQPLGMTHTAITFTPWMKQHLAIGHDASGKVTANWDLPTLAGAGAIRSTTDDMLKFLAANLHPERGPLERAMAFAHEERAPTGSANMRIGLNWFSLHAGSDTIVWHNGGTGGYRTFIGFEPSRKVGVVVMTNSGGEGADDIGRHLLDPALPLTPKPAEYTAIVLADSVMEPYVGVYQLAPKFDITITLETHGLYTQATGQEKFQVWPYSDRDFFAKIADIQLRFVVTPEGRVTGVVVRQAGQPTIAKKIK